MTHSSDHAIDRMTLVAIAIVAYALANLIHEGLGHGATCVAVGGRLSALSAIHAECAAEGEGRNALVTAAGTLANVFAGATAWLLLRWQKARHQANSSVPLGIDRSLGWIALAGTTAVLFVAILGPGFRD